MTDKPSIKAPSLQDRLFKEADREALQQQREQMAQTSKANGDFTDRYRADMAAISALAR